MLNRFGSPTVSELYSINTFYPGVQRRLALWYIIGLVGGYAGLGILAAAVGCALLFTFALPPLYGAFVLWGLSRSRGRDMPRKVIEWFRSAKQGDRLNLDLL